ncbi:MAG: diguanylate cyclase [Zoogloeaceae bacterium]|nr:diguanylate cyclase [Zoogloeaceae bacterium]
MSSRQNTWRQITRVGIIIVITAWAIAFWQRHEVEQKLYADTGLRMQAMAETYASHAGLSMAIADESLKRLQDILQHDGEEAFGLAARFMSRTDTLGGAINRVALTDAHGRTRHAYQDGMMVASADVSGRDYFKAFRDDPSDRIVVTEPILGKASGKWIVLFVRPIRSDGKFAGVIFVGIGVEKLSQLLSIPKEKGLLITLLSPGNHVVARSVAGEQMIGRELQLPPDTADGTTFDMLNPLDGVTRRVAVSRVPDWGMHVIAGMDDAVIRNEVNEQARMTLLPPLLLSLLLLPAAFVIRRAFHHQKKAEHERNLEAARSQTVLEGMSEGVLLVDAQGRIIFSNEAATRWIPGQHGASFTEAIATSGLALTTEDGNPYAVEDPLRHVCLESGQDLDDIWLVETDPQKQMQWLAMRARPLSSAEGTISGAIVTLDNRTDEHERIADAEMSRTILARMNDAVLITDARADILMVNRAYVDLSGYSETELIGKPASIVRSERHDDAFWAAVWQSLTQQKKWSGTVWNQRKDGREYCVWHIITAVQDQRGRVVRYVAVSRDITEQQENEAELWQRANSDPLTGLANRCCFNDRLTQSLEASARHQQTFAVLYLDLDRFKPVNDALGHAAGDEVLRQVARRLQASLRSEDTLARIGGDEFALLMPRIALAQDAVVVATKILAAINTPLELFAGTVNVGVSIGIAVCPAHGNTATSLLAAADSALYVAKSEGRNTWRMAPDLPAQEP